MNKSFTLIEVLVVIVIIGIISAFIIVSMAGISSRANIAKGQVFVNSIRNSLLMSLMSEWKLDEGSGQTANDTWTGINGTLGSTSGVDDNDPVWVSSDCVNNYCLFFDGINDYVVIPNDSRLHMREGSITVSSWVKLINLPASYAQVFYGGASGGGTGYGFMIRYTGVVRYEIYGSTGGRQSFMVGNVVKDRWYNLVMTFNHSNDNLKMYIDSVVAGDNTLSDPGNVVSTAFSMGAYGSLALYFLDGYIDETKIFTEAVSAYRVKENYYSGLNRLLISKQIDNREIQERLSQLK